MNKQKEKTPKRNRKINTNQTKQIPHSNFTSGCFSASSSASFFSSPTWRITTKFGIKAMNIHNHFRSISPRFRLEFCTLTRYQSIFDRQQTHKLKSCRYIRSLQNIKQGEILTLSSSAPRSLWMTFSLRWTVITLDKSFVSISCTVARTLFFSCIHV